MSNNNKDIFSKVVNFVEEAKAAADFEYKELRLLLNSSDAMQMKAAVLKSGVCADGSLSSKIEGNSINGAKLYLAHLTLGFNSGGGVIAAYLNNDRVHVCLRDEAQGWKAVWSENVFFA
jgi:hypothetical protein